jgi:hypothetical protein
MPTVQQLEQRLGRLTKKLSAARQSGGSDAAVALRLMHKRQRRLQRKLRRKQPAPAPARPAQGSAPPPAESQGDKQS